MLCYPHRCMAKLPKKGIKGAGCSLLFHPAALLLHNSHLRVNFICDQALLDSQLTHGQVLLANKFYLFAYHSFTSLVMSSRPNAFTSATKSSKLSVVSIPMITLV